MKRQILAVGFFLVFFSVSVPPHVFAAISILNLDGRNIFVPGSRSGLGVTVTDSSGNAVTSGTTWTSSDPSVVSVTPIDATREWVTGVGPGTATVTATNGSQSASAGMFFVELPITSSLVDPEPTFDSSSQVMLVDDNFDSYTSFADANKNGWHSAGSGGNVQDTSTNPSGANLVISPGRSGSGKAIRLVYDGISASNNGQEPHDWAKSITDTLAGKPGYAVYVSYYFKINPGPGTTLDQDSSHKLWIKWLELWFGGVSDRAQFSIGYEGCGRTSVSPTDLPLAGGGTIWSFWGNGGSNTNCKASQIRPPYAMNGAGAWHRVTFKLMTQSPGPYTGPFGGGMRDGVGQMWYDGTLIVSAKQNYCGVIVPGAPAIQSNGTINPPHWCENDDLDQMRINNYINLIELGSVQIGVWPFSLDFDDFQVWRDNGGSTPPPYTPPVTPPVDVPPVTPSTPPPSSGPGPQIISSGPSGTYPSNTTGAILSVTTNVNATCKYSTTANTSYSSMSTFGTTGGILHSNTLSTLSPQTYNYYIKCADQTGNIDTADYPITFTISGGSTDTTTDTTVVPPPADPLAAVIALILDNRPLFTKATSLGITLPPLIQKVLDTGSLTQADLDGTATVQFTQTQTTTQTTSAVTSSPTSHTTLSLSSITRPLKLNYIGTDVILLQNFLIQTNAGPQARSLATHGANGSFGPLTQSALMEYQRNVGVGPTGVLDAATKNRAK